MGEAEELVGPPSPPVLPCGPHGRDESRGAEQQWGIHTFGSSGHSVGYGEGRQGRKRQRNRAVCPQGSTYPSHRVKSLGESRSPR